MPSEGLNLEQMCQAVQSVGASASVLAIKNLTEARGYLHSAILSGFAPVLLIEDAETNRGHAVAVAGMKVRTTHKPTLISKQIDDEAGDLVSLYVNDDRSSPYFRVELPSTGEEAILSFKLLNDHGRLVGLENWQLSYILIPMHGKIRLSFADIRELAVEVVTTIDGYRGYYEYAVEKITVGPIGLRSWICRAPNYIANLFYGKQQIEELQRGAVSRRILLSRYVGVVRLTSESFGRLDILFDTTSTKKNPHCLGVVARIPDTYFASALATFLSIELKCPLVTDARTL
jgi:hypothetical protein